MGSSDTVDSGDSMYAGKPVELHSMSMCSGDPTLWAALCVGRLWPGSDQIWPTLWADVDPLRTESDHGFGFWSDTDQSLGLFLISLLPISISTGRPLRLVAVVLPSPRGARPPTQGN